jgi:hypothetical protein
MVDNKSLNDTVNAAGRMSADDYAVAAFALVNEILTHLEQKGLMTNAEVRRAFMNSAAGLKTGDAPSLNAIKFLEGVGEQRKPMKG